MRRFIEIEDDDAPEFMPHLLAELESDLARSRMREAFWISVIVHIVLVVGLFTSPKWMPDWSPVHFIRAEDLARAKQPTFLALPNDLQKPPQKVQSDKVSDKNRIAQSTRPQLDQKALDVLREARMRGNMMPPGAPGPAPQPQGAPQQAPQGSERPMNNFSQPRVQPERPEPAENPFRLPGSAGAAIAEATRNAPRVGSIGGGGGGYGMGSVDRNARMGPFDVLSDTEGVDFGPYLSRVLQSIKVNWYNLIPEEARSPLMKHGKVAIRFLITPNGKVAGMFIEAPSGDIPLDRAAYGGITASDPFSPLPHDFHGPYLALRITFFYNPKEGEMVQ